jgi:hypothetical protein
LGSTLISFQTEEYARHFVQTCSRILSVEAVPRGCMLDDRLIRVSCAPIGIDLAALQKQIQDPQVISSYKFLKERYAGKRLLVSRDKFDRIKGLKPKMLAFERFLADYPEWIEKVVSRVSDVRWSSYKLPYWVRVQKKMNYSPISTRLSLVPIRGMVTSYINPWSFDTKISSFWITWACYVPQTLSLLQV